MAVTKGGSYDIWLKKSEGMLPSRQLWGPLFLIVCIPPAMVLLPYVLVHLDGSLLAFYNKLVAEGTVKGIYNMWYTWKDPTALKIIGLLVLSQLILVKLVPGEKFTGPVSPAGMTYTYNANGLRCFLITMAAYWLGSILGFYNGGILVDKLGEIVSSINVLALVLCFLLYLKGIYAPSSADNGTTGNIVFDYFWGTELNPRVFGWDIKQLTNARFGMMFWGLFLLSGILKQVELYGRVYDTMWVNAGLQLLYVTKFYYWETGYYSSYDIIHDYAGFYLCWGCTCFMPSIYSSHTLWIALHPVDMGWPIAGAMIVAGVAITLIQYDADTQARNFRKAGGKCKIWGKDPEYIVAKYKTGDGSKEESNMLLASGYYGSVRHIRYSFDITIAALWCIPCWTDKFLPYVYFPYAVIMLVDRMYRIDIRCAMKYGKYWEEYCRRIPYYMIPGIF